MKLTKLIRYRLVVIENKAYLLSGVFVLLILVLLIISVKYL